MHDILALKMSHASTLIMNDRQKPENFQNKLNTQQRCVSFVNHLDRIWVLATLCPVKSEVAGPQHCGQLFLFFVNSTGEYPGDNGWDSAGPAASPKACGTARVLHHHFQSRLVPMLAALSLGCCSAAPLGIVLACCSAAALPCLAPYPRQTNGPASVAVANANALQLPLPPKPGWPVSRVLWVLRHAVGHLR